MKKYMRFMLAVNLGFAALIAGSLVGCKKGDKGSPGAAGQPQVAPIFSCTNGYVQLVGNSGYTRYSATLVTTDNTLTCSIVALGVGCPVGATGCGCADDSDPSNADSACYHTGISDVRTTALPTNLCTPDAPLCTANGESNFVTPLVGGTYMVCFSTNGGSASYECTGPNTTAPPI